MPKDFIPPPDVMVTDEPLVSICVNRSWVRVIEAMIAPFQYPERWSGTLEQSRFAREQVRQLMYVFQKIRDCDDMTDFCCPIEENVLIQVNPDLSISVSEDGGSTFTQSKTDPRYQTPQLPTPPAGVNKCEMAEGYIVGVQEWVGKMHDFLGHTETLGEFLIECIEGLLEIILLFVIVNPATATGIVGVAGQILKQWFGTPQADWDALWTEENYNAIRCIIFCNLNENGQFDETSYAQAASEFLGGTISGGTDVKGAAINAQNMFKFWQLKGVNSMMVANKRATTFDCDECVCPSCADLFVTTINGTIIDRGEGFVTVEAADIGSGHWQASIKTGSAEECCNWSGTELIAGTPGGLFNSCWNCGSIYPGDGQDFSVLFPVLATTCVVESTSGSFTIKFTFLV
jgi:hypothetical protein